jgi:hypothetical protein
MKKIIGIILIFLIINPMISIIVTSKQDPDLEIQINGGFGITTIITNNGINDIENLYWNFSVKGGIINGLNYSFDGNNFIRSGDSFDIIDRVRGLGEILISVTVKVDNDFEIVQHKNAFLILFFVIIRE